MDGMDGWEWMEMEMEMEMNLDFYVCNYLCRFFRLVLCCFLRSAGGRWSAGGLRGRGGGRGGGGW